MLKLNAAIHSANIYSYAPSTVLGDGWAVMHKTDIVPEFGSLESSRY